MKIYRTFIDVLLCILVIGVFVLSVAGCGKGGTETGTTESGLHMTSAAVKATPQIFGTLATADITPKSYDQSSNNSDATTSLIESFFKAECHTDNNSLNLCPSGVETTLDNKFTTTTLIGLIQHADMYLGNVYTSSEIVDPETGESISTPTYKTCGRGTNAAELTDHTPVYSPADSDNFVIDFGSLFDCVGEFTFVTNTSYALYSKAADDLTFAGLTSRKQEESTEDYAGVMSDIFQSYLRRDLSSNPIILGFNLASYDYKGGNDSAGRSLLLTNISKNQFMVKYISGLPEISGYTDGYTYIIALGTAGYDPTTSVWVDGYYLVKSKSHDDDPQITCVQNGLTPSIVEGPEDFASWEPSDSSPCSSVAGFFSDDGWTIEEVYDWLEAEESDRTNLAGFDGYFDDADFLTSDDIPHNNSDYFPDSISR